MTTNAEIYFYSRIAPYAASYKHKLQTKWRYNGAVDIRSWRGWMDLSSYWYNYPYNILISEKGIDNEDVWPPMSVRTFHRLKVAAEEDSKYWMDSAVGITSEPQGGYRCDYDYTISIWRDPFNIFYDCD